MAPPTPTTQDDNSQYQVTVFFPDGTQEVTADILTRRDAWGLAIRLCKRGYKAAVTTPGTRSA